MAIMPSYPLAASTTRENVMAIRAVARLLYRHISLRLGRSPVQAVPVEYDSGDWLPGHRATANLTERPESVLTHQQWQDVSTLAKPDKN